MKVMLVVRWPVGGIRTFLNYVYSSWVSPELELHIVVPNLPEVLVLKEQLKHLNCVWSFTANANPSFMNFLTHVRDNLKGKRFDIIHAHGFTSALAVAWILPFLKAKSIFTNHDVLNGSQFKGIRGKVKKLLIPLFLNRFTVVHSVSEDACENLMETLPLINPKKCLVISNGVDTDKFYFAKGVDLKTDLNISPDSILIGFFGRFMAQKGFKYLVEAIASLERQFPGKYKVVTFGGDGFIREEQMVIESRNLSHVFFFHQPVPDISKYVKACDLVVMPSLWESCGLVAMEVLAAGIPIVSSNCIGLREVCRGTPAIMVEPANSKSLEAGILQTRENASSFSDYSSVAKERYNVSKTQEQFQALYIELESNDES